MIKFNSDPQRLGLEDELSIGYSKKKTGVPCEDCNFPRWLDLVCLQRTSERRRPTAVLEIWWRLLCYFASWLGFSWPPGIMDGHVDIFPSAVPIGSIRIPVWAMVAGHVVTSIWGTRYPLSWHIFAGQSCSKPLEVNDSREGEKWLVLFYGNVQKQSAFVPQICSDNPLLQ